ncbi:hypothetical protein [Nonomuraea rhodomycinica]|uniref:Lipoprotein n=1 Tax=Nonomuraea rhodomycinica TaxID=1712872 RepID=A0A7Y6IXJ9_9ACTN|nr:hypothetical protein [Nonomuraea rhodomycinica]NUW45698.1 hypothetical protein [Nonomuraea rhodomycinica]
MRRCLASAIIVLAVAGCGSDVPVTHTARTTPGPVTVHETPYPDLTCGDGSVTLTYVPSGLSRGPAFNRVKSLTRKLHVRGRTWRGSGGEQLLVGVVCGVRSVETFAGLVSRAGLGAYEGMPALRWRTRGDMRNFMWLERPGVAVYVAATPGLAHEVRDVADGVALDG